MSKKRIILFIGIAGILGSQPAASSCSSTVCSFNTYWDEHGPARPGWAADLRYTYSRADTLRSGSKKIAADTGADEVENLRTINKWLTASLDYTHNEHWGMMLILPYVDRDHKHHLEPYTGPGPYESFHARALEDIKVIGRYRWQPSELSPSEVGVKFGLKLNTGKKDFVIEQTGAVPGETAMQPGNGSTDLILGAFWLQARHGSQWSGFAQGTFQDSIKSSAHFTPGNQINMDGGVRYAFNARLSGLLQLNAQWNGTDSGSSAAMTPSGTPSSGGRSLAFTPGLTLGLSSDTQLYGLVQWPLYQYVNGEQLTADASYSMGLNHRF